MGLENTDRLNLFRLLGRNLTRAGIKPSEFLQKIISRNPQVEEVFLEGAEIGQSERMKEERKKEEGKPKYLYGQED